MSAAVAMSVVKVGVMGMAVTQQLMAMPVRMRLRHRSVVAVPMMRIMDVTVLVLKRLVLVFVIMPFGQVHP